MSKPLDIDPDEPIRLSEIAPIAFPRGGMTASGLRREADRGRLEIWRIAGKDFTSLSAIEEMKKKCRVQKSQRDYGSGQHRATERQSGSSSTAANSIALDTAQMIVNRLKSSSQNGKANAS